MTLKDQVIQCCIDNISDAKTMSWFRDKLKRGTGSSFFIAFSMVNRKIDRTSIRVGSELSKALKKVDPCFTPELWTLDQFCRLALLLNVDPDNNKETVTALLGASDGREQVAIFKSLYYLNNAGDFIPNAVDGIRTNMIDVYDAIALNNAYPCKYFSEDAWNQLVLKAIFMERPIYRIYGLEARSNQKLANILSDYAHERWAAGRRVTPELWRMMQGFVTDSIVKDLKKVILSDKPEAQQAAIKVIEGSNHDRARNWLASQEGSEASMTWEEIGRAFWQAASK